MLVVFPRDASCMMFFFSFPLNLRISRIFIKAFFLFFCSLFLSLVLSLPLYLYTDRPGSETYRAAVSFIYALSCFWTLCMCVSFFLHNVPSSPLTRGCEIKGSLSLFFHSFSDSHFSHFSLALSLSLSWQLLCQALSLYYDHLHFIIVKSLSLCAPSLLQWATPRCWDGPPTGATHPVSRDLRALSMQAHSETIHSGQGSIVHSWTFEIETTSTDNLTWLSNPFQALYCSQGSTFQFDLMLHFYSFVYPAC